ncbi:hypothetical protein C4D60_Mb04t10380 [Musa balbisiana]|uniref:Uncharacterized protein n=1 Tax=Musa balbisiana TaxID=52838 RepID=A0A4V4H9N3_MUSBA|nr:hypothetical protein C4D60_Mb04t10380 [Musa balbisiana]
MSNSRTHGINAGKQSLLNLKLHFSSWFYIILNAKELRTVEEWKQCDFEIPYMQDVPSVQKYHLELTRGLRASSFLSRNFCCEPYYLRARFIFPSSLIVAPSSDDFISGAAVKSTAQVQRH